MTTSLYKTLISWAISFSKGVVKRWRGREGGGEGLGVGSVMQIYGKEIFSTTFTVIELDLQFSIFVLK